MTASQTDPQAVADAWYRAYQRFLLSDTRFRGLARLLGEARTLTLETDALFDLHYKGIGYLHWTLNEGLRRGFTDSVSAFAEQWDGARPAGLTQDESPPSRAFERHLAEIDRDGYVALDPIPSETVATLRARFEDGPLTPWPQRLSGALESAPVDALRDVANLGLVPQDRLLAIPEVFEQAIAQDVLDLARGHLGAPPILINASAWRSFAGSDGAKEAKDAQLFHFDLDDYRFCKLFIYLTDVDARHGPHVFAPGTHRPSVIAARRPAEGDPDRAAFDLWYFKTLRKEEADVERLLGVRPVELTGAAGTRLLVNTEGVHRGKPPEAGDRWLLQFVYGVTPYTEWRGAPAPQVAAPDTESLSSVARYALQLLL
ncbi:MAG: phytanoyl-CoA dioxygenase family protein [Alphaproteobacteria bacterium]|nr:phytanoyl-CoA dioxygenase family protein [Alphaproteobacteria bacterium]